ncbi:hypothetical protein ACFL0Q_04085, partial [Thermodesulfobacteriota bacterium]
GSELITPIRLSHRWGPSPYSAIYTRLLFPGNKNHQRVFLTVFIDLKYSSDQFALSLNHLCKQYAFSHRLLEIVRSKMRRMGLIDHVSRFNKSHGYREGWVFSNRFKRSLKHMVDFLNDCKERNDAVQKKKDRNLLRYI